MSEELQNSSCKFSGELVAYLYRELAGKERLQFESHLAVCQACIDEFALIADSRFSVYEWHKSEFAPLETPVINIPDVRRNKVRETSLFATVSAAISFRPAFAAAAAIVLFGSILIATEFLGDEETARANEAGSGTSATVIPDRRPPTVATLNRVDKGDEFITTPLAEEPKQVNAERRAKGVRISQPSSRGLAQQSARTSAARADKLVPGKNQLTTSEARNEPRLNEFSEDQDESLRLAELFDDIDTIE
jgi:hypothetical protein